ncbi:GFA family protein [Acidovorax sp. NPDC077693]|uniref:GFA family protein n=1 Tax=unclassified Acidovorax TaxID=2684926 RepID=UPI0037C80D0D
MKHTGACHCGKVSFRFKSEVKEIIRCDCSLCMKRNALMVTVPRADFEIVEGQDALILYTWNSEVARHYFCGFCGIYLYHRRRTNPEFLSINACCVEGLELEAISVRLVDGKSRSVVPAK